MIASRASAAEVRAASVTMPNGLSISPAAANDLVGCKARAPEGIEIPTGKGNGGEGLHPDEAGEGEEIGADGLSHLAPGHCPSGSEIGEVEVKTPVLSEPLKGHVYVAEPQCGGPGQKECTESSATNGELYGLYLEVAGSGVIIKLKGTASVDPKTGQITTTFKENPQFPFEELKIKLNGGPRAPLANPQTCGTATTTSLLEPWSHQPGPGEAEGTPDATPSSSFDVTGCKSPMGFAPGFEAGTTLPVAAGYSPFTMTLKRNDGEQDLAGLTLSMPPGLAGAVSSVPLCPEPQAQAGTCSDASRIGTVHAAAGAGSEPLWLEGPVYLTGPYKGAPFGLSVVVPATAGPFNLGNVIERAAIYVDPHTAQVTVVSDPFPQIRDGVPFRLKELNVTVDRKSFMFNPTSCEQLHVGGTVSADMPDGSAGATAPVSNNFAVAGCRNLPFKPKFSASTSAKTSRTNGASLHVSLLYPKAPFGTQANIAKVHVELPKALPSRLSTLNHACLDSVFNQNPASCPAQSRVGYAKAVTPVLPVPLEGPAYFVSHGGQKFPELVMVLQGYGITLYLEGETFISKAGITSSTFKSVPDVPVSSFELTLPQGTNSALAANKDLCTAPLPMPTTITAQNGAVIKQSTKIAVQGCKPAIRVLGRRVKGSHAFIRVSVPSAGTLVATGKGMVRSVKRAPKAKIVTIEVGLSPRYRRAATKRRLKVRVKVALSFRPRHGKALHAQTRLLLR
jgi:hypothetical protein